jgi:hypothetical protein
MNAADPTVNSTIATTEAAASMAEVAAFALSGPQLAALVSAAARLVVEVEAIRANAVDAWSQVETDFTAAADAWTAAVETPVAQSAIAAGHYNDARLSGAAPAVSQASGIVTEPAVTVSPGDGVQHVQV